MNATKVLKELARIGKPSTAAIYRRHGVREETYGVPYSELGNVVSRLGTNHELALALWDSGIHDARVLATKLAAPERVGRRTIDAWLRACSNYVINDAISSLAARTPGAQRLVSRWTTARDEWTSAAGWNVVTILATEGALGEGAARKLVDRIRRELPGAPNRTRHAMNNALIAIGGSTRSLRPRAIETARAIGRVVVDHGETGCKTPDAEAYMSRMAARSPKRTRATGARMARATRKAARKTAKRAGRKKLPKG